MEQRRRDSKAGTGAPVRSRTLVERLEPRILLSADLPLLPPDDPGATAEHQRVDDAAGVAVRDVASLRHELVLIDAGVEDRQALLDDLRARSGESTRFDVHLLDAGSDGIAKIAEVLAGYDRDLDAVHVISHGADGAVQLGDTWLTSETLGERASELASWGAALAKDADLLFYGCDLAASDDGRSLVDQLAVLTGADVAASSDATGAAAQGGDWELEHRAGVVETSTMRLHLTRVLGGTALWAEAGSNVPETAEFDGSSFGAEGVTVDVGGEWRVMAGASSPTSDEKIVVGVNELGKIDSMVWDGTSWIDTSPLLLGTGTVPDPENWVIDVAYESQSGHAVFVYNNDLTSQSGYSVWNGSSWSVPGTIPQPISGDAQHIKLAASPGSDEIVVVVSNENNRDYAAVWDGSSWGDSIVLHDAASASNNTEVNVVYESQSGDAMVVWGEGNDKVHYRVWDGSSWGGELELDAPSSPMGDVRWTSVAADPASDRIVLAVGTDVAETWFSVWDGGGWGTPQQGSDQSHRDRQSVAAAFESQSGQAIVAYSVDGFDEVRYQTWSSGGGWSGELVGPSFASEVDALTLDADPFSDEVMLSVVESGRDVSFTLWDGSSFGTPEVLETNAGSNKAQPFLFLWDQYSTNVAPTANPDAATVGEGASVVIDLAGNDNDPEGLLDLGSITITAGPSHGTLVDNGDGTLTYTHDGSETTGDSFSYTIDDTVGETSNVAAVTLTVTPQNDAPTATPDIATVDEGQSITIDLAGNDNDPEGLLDLGSITITSGPSNGTLVDNGDGTLTYTHDGSETTGDSFSYTIDDTAGETSNVAAVTLTVTPQNDAPTATPDSATVGEGQVVVIDLASNDSDPEGLLDLGSITITSGPSNGTLVDNGDGTLTYTHDGSETTGDSFSYTIDDTAGATSNVAAVTLTITPQNDAPTATPDAATVDEGQSITIDLAGNDNDPEGLLDLGSITITSGPSHGTLVDNGDGTLTYTHDGSETTGDSFSYTIDDTAGETSNVAAVTLTVTPQNDAPTATPDSATVGEGQVVVIDLASNDSDPEGLLDLGSITITAGPSHGTLVDNGDGTLTYTHDGSETTGDSFSYTIDDTAGETSNVAAVTLTITPQNDTPTATPDVATVDEGQSITIDLAGNDVDPEGLLDLGSITITSGPSNGTLVDNGDGTLTYTHDGSETTGDSFSYTIDDTSGATSNVAAVTLTVTPQNDTPTATPDAATVDEGQSITIDLAGNDNDPEGLLDLGSITITSGPSNGTLVDNGDGTLTYTHDGSETTGDSFSYTIDDTKARRDLRRVAAVTLTVTTQNDTPTATPDAATVDEGQSITIDLAGSRQ